MMQMRERHRSINWLGAVLLWLLASHLAWAQVSDELAHPSYGPLHDIFSREPLRFNFDTFKVIYEDCLTLMQSIRESPSLLLKPLHALGFAGGIALISLILATIFGLRFEHSLINALAQKEPWRAFVPPRIAELITIAWRMLACAMLPLALWLLWNSVCALLGIESLWYKAISDVLLIWLSYRAIRGVLEELLMRQQKAVSLERAQHLFNGLHLALRIGAILTACALVSFDLEYREDVTALIVFVLHISVSMLIFLSLLARDDILALLPRAPYPWYERLLALLQQAYYYLLTFSLIVSALWAFGYRQLAYIFFKRGWALLAVIIGAVYAYRRCERVLHERLIEAQPDSEIAARLYRILSRAMVLLLMGVVLWIATHLLNLAPALHVVANTSLGTVAGARLTLGAITRAVIILFVAALASQLIRATLNYAVYPRMRLDAGEAHAFNNLIHYVLLAIAAVLALRTLGMSLRNLAIVAGGLSVGIGFGLQNLANNLVSGLIILFGRQVRKGDLISIGELMGTVEEVGMRATVVRTLDNINILIPNSQLLSESLINWTHTDPIVRVHVPVGVSYNSNPLEVKAVLEKVSHSTPFVLEHPPPEVRFVEFGDSSLNFELLVWIDVRQVTIPRAKSDLNYAIFKALAEHGIEIPYPQRDLHLRSGVPWGEIVSALRSMQKMDASKWAPDRSHAEVAGSSDPLDNADGREDKGI